MEWDEMKWRGKIYYTNGICFISEEDFDSICKIAQKRLLRK